MFQEHLNSDIEQKKNNNKIFVSRDRSRNNYMLRQEEYTKLIKKNVIRNYNESTR